MSSAYFRSNLSRSHVLMKPLSHPVYLQCVGTIVEEFVFSLVGTVGFVGKGLSLHECLNRWYFINEILLHACHLWWFVSKVLYGVLDAVIHKSTNDIMKLLRYYKPLNQAGNATEIGLKVKICVVEPGYCGWWWCDMPVPPGFYLKIRFYCWTRYRIHYTLIAVDRYLHLMGDKTIPKEAPPNNFVPHLLQISIYHNKV